MDLPVHSEKRVRVVIVDEQPIYLDGLRSQLLEFAADIEVVAEAYDGDTAFQLAVSLLPDVILMDMSRKSSKCSTLEATKRINEAFPNIKILILSADDSIESIMGTLRAGASGYLLKSVSIQELKEAIFTMMNHGCVLTPAVAQKLLSVLSHPVASPCVLSERELEILKDIKSGLSNKAIANKLRLSTRTIEVHVSHIFQKLAVSSRTQAVMKAIKLGILVAPALEQIS